MFQILKPTLSFYSIILFILLFFLSSNLSYKLVVITDSNGTDQSTYFRYINSSAYFWAPNSLQIQNVDLSSFSSAEEGFQKVCSQMNDGSFIISLAQNKPAIDVAKKVYHQTAVPTLQIKYGPWVYKHSDLSSSEEYDSAVTAINAADLATNYVTFVQPSTVLLNFLRDLVEKINITEATILYDTNYRLDASIIAALSNLPLGQRYHRMETNDTEIAKQISQLKPLGGKNLVLMGSVQNVANYVKQAEKDMITKTFNWFIVTKDPRQFQCNSCVTSNTFWIRPIINNSASYFSTVLENFQNITAKTQPDLLDEMNKLTYSFFLDITTIAWNFMKKVEQKASKYPLYNCSTNSFASANGDNSITKIIKNIDLGSGSVALAGAYGNYEMDTAPSALGNYYQTINAKIDSVLFDAQNQIPKTVGDWTLGALRDPYESLVNLATIKHYRVVVVKQEPFVIITQLANGENNYTGYCKDLLDKIAKEVGFNYTIYETQMYGVLDNMNSWNGMIGELVSGRADIALGALSVTAERESFVDFTVPYYDLVGTTILMRRPAADYDLFKFMTVLEGPVWGCIVGAYFFTSILLWVFDRFSPYSYTNNKEKYKDDPEQREFNFKECLWFCMTSLTPQGGGEAPKNISGRLVAATWWLFGFIIIASYTANLAAFLTVSRLESQITSLDDLAKQYKVKYAPVAGTASETYFKRMADIENRFYDIWKAMSLNESMTPQERAQLAVWDYPVSDKFNNMWRYMQEAGLENTTETAIKRVENSPASSSDTDTEAFAFIGDATEIRFAQMTNCKVMMVGTEFSRKPYAIAVQQLSPLKEQISSAILKLLNARELEQLKEYWWNKNPKKADCPKQDDESDGISIQNIGGVFIVILIGIVLSLITLAFEYWYYRDKRRILREQKAQEKRATADREVGTVQNINVETSKENFNNNNISNRNAFGLGVFSSNDSTSKH